MKYQAARRYQVAQVVMQGDRERLVNSAVARSTLEDATAAACHKRDVYGGIWVVTDGRPLRRCGGLVEKHGIVYNTVTGRA